MKKLYRVTVIAPLIAAVGLGVGCGGSGGHSTPSLSSSPALDAPSSSASSPASTTSTASQDPSSIDDELQSLDSEVSSADSELSASS